MLSKREVCNGLKVKILDRDSVSRHLKQRIGEVGIIDDLDAEDYLNQEDKALAFHVKFEDGERGVFGISELEAMPATLNLEEGMV